MPRIRLTFVLALAIVGMLAASARAGVWTLASCTNPNGSPAPTDGWGTAAYGSGGITPDSGDSNTCAQGGALTAVSDGHGQPQSYSGPEWIFTAPSGTTIAGGQITATLTSPQGQTWIGTPTVAYDGADVFVNCQLNLPCGANGTESGTFTISHPGGTALYAPALCVIFSSPTCPLHDGVNAEISIHAAEIELVSQAEPAASGFSGPLLRRQARGVAGLLFTAGDPGGPGVYQVTVIIDRTVAYRGTPDANGGMCVPVAGSSPSDLVFDHAQPCRTSEGVDVPVDTRRLLNGPHELRVLVSDAAGNTAPVLDHEISVENPVVTPRPRRALHVQMVIHWRWFRDGDTRILGIGPVHRLPRRVTVQVRCIGGGCPWRRVVRTSGATASRLWRRLDGRRLHSGARLLITLTAPGRRAERIEIRFRSAAAPLARLLG